MSVLDYRHHPDRPPPVRYCKKCVNLSSSALPMSFSDDGLCSACQVSTQRVDVDWDKMRARLDRIVKQNRSRDGSNYDCVIPVSGGKDSYYQIHLVKNVLGLNPLLVTYHGNNYTPTGMVNLKNMREAFDVDHIFFTPSIRVLKVMNRVGMRLMGDMNWHAHAGIFTYPIRVAVQHRIPLMFWGEHGYTYMAGMFNYEDMVEFTYRYRHEHGLRGFEWYDLMEAAKTYGEELEQKDLIPWVYPSDEQIDDVGVRGLYLSNFFPWEPNRHIALVKERYGFKEQEEPFERTYRRMSNLDDMHENGIHDYMKFIKFGYGRASDHTCKDIRDGLMTREEAVEIVRRMDHVKPKDLYRWLDYVGWSEEEFDRVADSFRDPRVWWIKEGRWHKDNLWGGDSDYGEVIFEKKG